MLIRIKNVRSLPNGEYGTCRRYRNVITIEMSLKKNKTIADYFSTLLHELLHAWVYIMNLYGIKVPLKNEHDWIYKVEKVLIKTMHRLKEVKK